ncbi:LysR substrate-binding domain-containing protein [Paraburkholderia antibiotica]|uniref:LysR family transcriptional regulator n=1 Tax=Paraburkholderia antibiotica TaxID=2728839 RepID=A0A7X9ZZG9_9BURK|nr:LysR substrate-binding domain-containing protein [Paraburkholderia antibiotica]NML33055.1 LysR family transcriptional regulator [Paraburkholderia antibiotica]
MSYHDAPLARDLPPLLTLRVFEAVARNLSFIRAADELAVTQSAVSHQIQKLEQYLGVLLFVRRTRSIELTAEGNSYYEKVRKGLESIAEGTRQIRGIKSRTTPLKVSLLSSFATHWLAPRLVEFSAAYPDIRLQLMPSIELANIGAGAADIAIRYGEGHWPNVASTLLMRERIAPVCSPAYLAEHGPFKSVNDMREGPLLMSYALRHFEWDAWSSHVQWDLTSVPKVMLHDYNIVLEAAVAGNGIAMGRHRLIEKRLAAGTLVEIFPELAYEGTIGYWLVTPDAPLDSVVNQFLGWIKEAAIAHALAPLKPASH